jgi:hypothetical protein
MRHLFRGPIMTRCPWCYWSQRIWLRIGEARARDCELCGKPFRTVRLPVRVSVSPLDTRGIAIAYTMHDDVRRANRWL